MKVEYEGYTGGEYYQRMNMSRSGFLYSLVYGGLTSLSETLLLFNEEVKTPHKSPGC
jgi:hypothetical protein